MICLSCHGPNDLTLGYVSRDSYLIIGQLERIKLFYLYKCNRIENVFISFKRCQVLPAKDSVPSGLKSKNIILNEQAVVSVALVKQPDISHHVL